MQKHRAAVAAAGVQAAQPESGTPNAPPADITPPEAVINEADIAARAYSYWEDRGCEGGSAEEDWYRAVYELTLEREERARAARSGS